MIIMSINGVNKNQYRQNNPVIDIPLYSVQEKEEKTVDKMEDRRVQRTRNTLFDAFVDLMIEKGYEAITIQDIVDYANIGRSTFYLHFTDKEQLLLFCIDNLRSMLREFGKAGSAPKPSEEYRFGFSLAMIKHAQSHKRLYHAIIGKKGGAVVMEHMKKMISDLAGEEISALLPEAAPLAVPQSAVIEFAVNTLWILLVWWMDGNMPCSAEELDGIFHRLTLSGLNGLK